jgi:glycosyltransferase involved in cell wall biosynthesis
MKFYCYSEIDESTIASRLGDADYSYYFVMKAYIPLLETLGSVHTITQMDGSFVAQCEQALSAGEECYLLAFAPPHKIPYELPCPVIPVFAWEYSSIPNREFINDPKDSWCNALEHFGQAITHSSYAKRVVAHDMHENFAIESIPAPLWDKFARFRANAAERNPIKACTITMGTAVIDSWNFAMDSETISPANRIARPMGAASISDQPCESIHIEFGKINPEIMTVGFYAPEGWGAWSKTASPWIMLPSVVSGKVRLKITMNAHGPNVGRDIRMQVGDKSIVLDLKREMVDLEFDLDIEQPSNFISFSNLDISDKRTPADPRTIGIGLATLSIESRDQATAGQSSTTTQNTVRNDINLNGVVYISIFNPRDGRKNWEDILTAFCWAFREQEDVTLILKMTYKDMSGYLDDIFALFCQLSPFKCRVVVVHGYISNQEYDALISATSYIVNASRSEGQCLPLMEYMSCGIPAIAPDNTAMADYISEENAFVVTSTPEPHYWPHDPQQIFTTLWYRPSWESLYKAYLASYEVAHKSPARYSAMSENAWRRQHDYCSSAVLANRLDRFLQRIREN